MLDEADFKNNEQTHLERKTGRWHSLQAMVNAEYFLMDHSALILDHLGLQLDILWAYKASYTFHETSPVSTGVRKSNPNLAPCCQLAPMALCRTVPSLVASASAALPVGSLRGQAWVYHCFKFVVNLFKTIWKTLSRISQSKPLNTRWANSLLVPKAIPSGKLCSIWGGSSRGTPLLNVCISPF